MRLGKDDFNKLLNEPMLDWVDHDEAHRSSRRAGAGSMFGCRANSTRITRASAQHPAVFHSLEAEYARSEGDVRLVLRYRARSSAGAFILNERGFKTRVSERRSEYERAGSSNSPLHRVGRLVAAECAGQIVLDFLLRGAAVLVAELDADPAVRLPCAPFGVNQITLPATGIFSSSPIRFSSMNTSSPRL